MSSIWNGIPTMRLSIRISSKLNIADLTQVSQHRFTSLSSVLALPIAKVSFIRNEFQVSGYQSGQENTMMANPKTQLCRLFWPVEETLGEVCVRSPTWIKWDCFTRNNIKSADISPDRSRMFVRKCNWGGHFSRTVEIRWLGSILQTVGKVR